MPAKKEASFTFGCDILNVLVCSTDFGETINSRYHYIILLITTIALAAQGVIVVAIFSAEEHSFLASENQSDNGKHFLA